MAKLPVIQHCGDCQHFERNIGGLGGGEWFPKCAEWLTERGLGIIAFECQSDPKSSAGRAWQRENLDYARRFQQNVYWIGSGPNANDIPHSTVWRGDQMVHDPNPNYGRSGIKHLDSMLFILGGTPVFVPQKPDLAALARLEGAL